MNQHRANTQEHIVQTNTEMATLMNFAWDYMFSIYLTLTHMEAKISHAQAKWLQCQTTPLQANHSSNTHTLNTMKLDKSVGINQVLSKRLTLIGDHNSSGGSRNLEGWFSHWHAEHTQKRLGSHAHFQLEVQTSWSNSRSSQTSGDQ